jgi:argininosuccinate lyase
MQLIKEAFIPMFDELNSCIDIVAYAVENMEVSTNAMENKLYKLAFTVEEVNYLVSQGVAFRDAYRQVGTAVQQGKFEYNGKLNHTHEGSIGNLCTDKIAHKFNKVLAGFTFETVHTAIKALTS